MTQSSAPQSRVSQSRVSQSRADQSLRRHELLGVFVMLTLFGGLGAWASAVEISGAVVAPGAVTVEGNPKKVQHLEGGIVVQINVRNGDVVKAGDVLFRLDAAETRAALQIVQVQLEEFRARRARLDAEQDDRDALAIPDGAMADPARAAVWQGQARLLEARRNTRLGKEQQLQERGAQLLEAVKGLQAQQQAKERQIALISEELDALLQLREQQLVAKPKVLALQREMSRLEGERGQHAADIARTHVQVSETQLQLAELRQSSLSTVLAELRETEAKIAELSERAVAGEARLRRLAIVAPRSGVVHKLSVHTVGGVISPGETIAEIVPLEDKLVLEGQLDPSNIDHVRPGQGVTIRFLTVDQRTTPESEGTVITVSPDVRQDGPNTPRYYAVRVAPDEQAIARLGGAKLVPGMPVELLIRRRDRTVLSFLVKPLLDRLSHTFREE